ncbi:FAD-binding domain [Francisella adeliensis]|uniref:FAD-binding domain n=1 Tax=Francisella adeliensis TaxID=2007306 RepID=A0A2Z4Y0L2_9GAMM|nr:FAD-binding domain [Francisella adeliensis]AXA34711.1 oxidoreductase [Francisella adeliensis]MBK2084760.1 FAD-binding domain [Francisella adeliensis]MBK2097297.1 FAD-binding domain [Francisella adeliensis]QIW12946.1 FAD-binding domain [Francisella adeliensis]QIW14825.1 FAD-binding domain [Francisella adeliensis]
MMKIAINGVGIAGPTLAWWLKEYGFEPVLFEKAPEFRTGGYLVDFWGAGCEVLKKMGLFEELKNKSYKIKNIHCFNGRGRRSSKVNISSLIEDNYGEFLSVKRGDISSVIYNACGEIETRFGTFVTSVENNDDKVIAHLSDGTKESFDLVIGADGLHSHTRSLAFSDSEFKEHDLNTFVAAFSLEDYKFHENYTYGLCIEDDRQISRVTLETGETLVMFTMSSNLVDKIPTTLDEKKEIIRSVFKDIQWEAPELLSRLNDVDNIYFDSVTQVKMNNWYNNRIALVGDAASCPSILMGQGSIFAIIEAYVLAGELYKAKGDYKVAFPAWQNKLKEIIDRKQKLGLMNLSTSAPEEVFKKYLSTITVNISSTPIVSKFIGAGIFHNEIEVSDYK